MPSNWNALFVAWAVSLIIVIGGGLFFELTHVPGEHEMGAERSDTVHSAPAEEPVPTNGAAEPQDEAGTMTDGDGLDTDQTAEAEPAANDETQSGMPDTGLAGQDPTTGLPVQPETPTESAPELAISGMLPVEADPALLESTNQGPLPRIGDDGRKPVQVYAAPAPTDRNKPRIALIVTDMGMMARNTRRAIAEMPPEVTFAFSPYAPNLIEWGEEARRNGHEVLLMIPMEPENYPQNDPGPLSLLTSYSTKENVGMLRASLGTLTGYVGIINHMGSRFTAAADSLRPVLDELQSRGLMIVDSRASQFSRAVNMARAIGLPSAYNNRYVDDNLSADAIAAELTELENYARATGSAVGVAHNYPVTINAVDRWAAGLEARGIVLVPVTSIADRQPLPR